METDLCSLEEKYRLGVRRFNQNTLKLDKEIKALQEKRDKLKYPNIKTVFAPFAKAMQIKLGAERIRWLGGFGLSNEHALWFLKGNDPDEVNNIISSINFVKDGDGWGIKDERVDTGKYPKGSIGEMNGMNHPTIPIDSKLTEDMILDIMRRS